MPKAFLMTNYRYKQVSLPAEEMNQQEISSNTALSQNINLNAAENFNRTGEFLTEFYSTDEQNNRKLQINSDLAESKSEAEKLDLNNENVANDMESNSTSAVESDKNYRYNTTIETVLLEDDSVISDCHNSITDYDMISESSDDDIDTDEDISNDKNSITNQQIDKDLISEDLNEDSVLDDNSSSGRSSSSNSSSYSSDNGSRNSTSISSNSSSSISSSISSNSSSYSSDNGSRNSSSSNNSDCSSSGIGSRNSSSCYSYSSNISRRNIRDHSKKYNNLYLSNYSKAHDMLHIEGSEVTEENKNDKSIRCDDLYYLNYSASKSLIIEKEFNESCRNETTSTKVKEIFNRDTQSIKIPSKSDGCGIVENKRENVTQESSEINEVVENVYYASSISTSSFDNLSPRTATDSIESNTTINTEEFKKEYLRDVHQTSSEILSDMIGCSIAPKIGSYAGFTSALQPSLHGIANHETGIKIPSPRITENILSPISQKAREDLAESEESLGNSASQSRSVSHEPLKKSTTKLSTNSGKEKQSELTSHSTSDPVQFSGQSPSLISLSNMAAGETKMASSAVSCTTGKVKTQIWRQFDIDDEDEIETCNKSTADTTVKQTIFSVDNNKLCNQKIGSLEEVNSNSGQAGLKELSNFSIEQMSEYQNKIIPHTIENNIRSFGRFVEDNSEIGSNNNFNYQPYLDMNRKWNIYNAINSRISAKNGFVFDERLKEYLERTSPVQTLRSPTGAPRTWNKPSEADLPFWRQSLPNPQDIHVCLDCGKRYSTSSNLARHRQIHKQSSAHYERVNQLPSHQVAYSPNESRKPRKCPHCEKSYMSMPAYSMHIRTHNQGCACPHCGKRFSRPWLLQGHVRTHTGEKPFSCGICGKHFADKSNLRAHVQTHSPEKPYVCGRCNKAFALKSYLYKHEESSCMRSPRTFSGLGIMHRNR